MNGLKQDGGQGRVKLEDVTVHGPNGEIHSLESPVFFNRIDLNNAYGQQTGHG